MPRKFSFNIDLTSSVNAPLGGLLNFVIVFIHPTAFHPKQHNFEDLFICFGSEI